MYPRNAASPPRIAIGAVVQISDGAVQTTGVSVAVRAEGGAEGAGGGTISYGASSGIVYYAPTQAETNYTAFVVCAYKTGCIPVAVTVVTTATAVSGTVDVGAVSGDSAAADNLELACDNYSATRGLAGTALPAAAADGPGGLPISDAGGLALDTILDAPISGAGGASTAEMIAAGIATEAQTGSIEAGIAAQTARLIQILEKGWRDCNMWSFRTALDEWDLENALCRCPITAATFSGAIPVDCSIVLYMVTGSGEIPLGAIDTTGTWTPATPESYRDLHLADPNRFGYFNNGSVNTHLSVLAAYTDCPQGQGIPAGTLTLTVASGVGPDPNVITLAVPVTTECCLHMRWHPDGRCVSTGEMEAGTAADTAKIRRATRQIRG